MLPPRWLRRLVIIPAIVFVVAVFLGTLPLLLVLAAAISPRLPGRWRPLRLLWFFLVYLAVEVVALAAALLLWIGSGFGYSLRGERMQRLHYGLLRRALALAFRTGRRAFNLSFDTSEVTGVLDADPDPDGPLLVFSRHAGAGDSFLLVHALTQAGRRPRIVLKATLQWDPLLDVILNRLPTVFVPSGAGRHRVVEGIRDLAAGMDRCDALLIFPEGGNFTERRRTRSIAKLEELGRHAEADLARQMRHVLAPHAAGAMAAIEAAPEADVVFVAHTGLERLSGVVDVWRGLPMDSDIAGAAWWVGRRDIPVDPAARTAWLYDWWLRIDRWIVDYRGESAVPTGVGERLRRG
jgi:1-acyl-sn-glycerol-3-phosphate acyltransferase